jgi:uncharacterized protein (TIGR03067 family)
MKWALVLMLASVLAAADRPASRAKKADQKDLQGTWVAQSVKGFKKEFTQAESRDLKLHIKGDVMHVTFGDQKAEATFQLAPRHANSWIDVTITEGPEKIKGKTYHGIYVLEANTFRVAFGDAGQARPREMTAVGEKGVYQVFFKRTAGR